MQSTENRALSIDEAAARLGVHRRTVVRMLDAGQLPSVKVRRRRVIPAEAVNALLAPAGAPPPAGEARRGA